MTYEQLKLTNRLDINVLSIQLMIDIYDAVWYNGDEWC